MTEIDEGCDLTKAKEVTLAGTTFYVMPLPLRQVIAMANIMPKMAGITADSMSDERLNAIGEVVWRGLKKAHPHLSLEAFMDLPITLAELIQAVDVVIYQAGGKKPDSSAGEQAAASGSNESTGNASSPG